MLQGVLATTLGAWQQVEHPELPNFQTWVIDPRAPKGFFRGSDGRWMHHWVPLPELHPRRGRQWDEVRRAGRAEAASATGEHRARGDGRSCTPTRTSWPRPSPSYPSDEWVRVASEVGVPVQPVRSPEEALLDPLLVADGCVTEVDDPELGRIRQVGRVDDLQRHPAAVRPGEPGAAHRRRCIAEADALATGGPPGSGLDRAGALGSPLDGVLVLDLGLAVAGPLGTQMLADLGADVIKVNPLHDDFWMSNHIAMCCNRGKRSIAINLKDPEAMAILHELVAAGRRRAAQHALRRRRAPRRRLRVAARRSSPT